VSSCLGGALRFSAASQAFKPRMKVKRLPFDLSLQQCYRKEEEGQ
jgi:hypothetical protein